MNDRDAERRGSAMLEACFDRAAAHAAALALTGAAGATTATRRKGVGWLRACLRRLVA